MKKLLTILIFAIFAGLLPAADKVAEQIMQNYESGSAKKEDTLAKLKMRKDALAKAGKTEEAKEVEEMIESMADEENDQPEKTTGTQPKSNSKNDYLIVDLKSRKLTYSATAPSDLLKKDKYKTDKLVMRRIPAGEFMMGETGNQHKVTLTKDFYIGVFEITQGHWEKVMKANPSYFKDVGKDAPVENVSWDDCQNFMKDLNGNKSSALAFRLPTEAEWEYACRGGDKTSKGFEYSGSATLDEVAWFNTNSGGKTHPVGQKKPNELGLYDMSGNVWEWCSDWRGDYPKEAETDPEGAKSGDKRILRGGGWYDAAGLCRSAYRGYYAPAHRDGNNLGFRLAVDCVTQEKNAKTTTRFTIFAPNQSTADVTNLAETLSPENPEGVFVAKTAQESLDSKSEVLVLFLDRDSRSIFGKEALTQLQKMKIIGIGYGAAELFGILRLEIRGGACAHTSQPQIQIQRSELSPKGCSGTIAAFQLKAGEKQNNIRGIDYNFGMYLPKKDDRTKFVEAIARWSGDENYAPIVKQGNYIMAGLAAPVTQWTPEYRSFFNMLASEFAKDRRLPFSTAVWEVTKPGQYDFALALGRSTKELSRSTFRFRFTKGTKFSATLEHKGSKNIMLILTDDKNGLVRKDANNGETLQIMADITDTDIERVGLGYWSISVTNFDTGNTAQCKLQIDY